MHKLLHITKYKSGSYLTWSLDPSNPGLILRVHIPNKNSQGFVIPAAELENLLRTIASVLPAEEDGSCPLCGESPDAHLFSL